MPPDTTRLPIAVDLDGTLVRTDTLIEALLAMLKSRPLSIFRILWWAMGGRARFKAHVARQVTADPLDLPYNEPLVSWLQTRRADGHSIWLCTASHQAMAQKIVDHLGLFDGHLCSTETVNLKGKLKAQALRAQFGEKGFIYCGNDTPDLAVWAEAAQAVVVGDDRLVRKARQRAPVLMVFPAPRPTFKTIIKAIRVHQWAKNILVFAVVGAAHRLNEWHMIAQTVAGFLAFSACASSVYLINDLFDLASDRAHPRKRLRPFASGALPVSWGLALAPALLLASFGTAAVVGPLFLLVLAGYFVTTLAYTFLLKSIVLLDIFTLALLYTARIVGGSAATGLDPSNWLLMLSLFLFLSLALVKRYAELSSADLNPTTKAAGRGYVKTDMDIIENLGTAAAYATTLVLALYVSSPDTGTNYTHPRLLWLLCPLQLYWISRIWMVTHRGHMHDDPLVFTFQDRISLLTAVFGGLIVVLAE